MKEKKRKRHILKVRGWSGGGACVGGSDLGYELEEALGGVGVVERRLERLRGVVSSIVLLSFSLRATSKQRHQNNHACAFSLVWCGVPFRS
jgi:hypothetical protein